METNYKSYWTHQSSDRIDEILANSDSKYEELNTIPNRERLTFKNGFYVNCSCVYMDIRESSKLTNDYQRPTLAKIYRSYASESVALLNGSRLCKEVTIDGDAVWGVLNTPNKDDINTAFFVCAQLSSLVKLLNCRFEKKTTNIKPITVGIGLDYGRALMLKAGFSGSGINDVVWMGDVVNQASKLSGYGNRGYGNKKIMVSDVIYSNLNDSNKSMLERNLNHGCYHCDVIAPQMEDWMEKKGC